MAANLGYCGLDVRRQPLAGDEIRACWEAGAAAPIEEDAPRIPALQPVDGADVRPRLEFIELEPARARTMPATASATTPDGPEPIEPLAPPDGRWSLWGDVER